MSVGTTAAPAQEDAADRRTAILMLQPLMVSALQAKNFGRARNIVDQAILWEPQNPVHYYNLACIEAQTGGARLPYAFGSLDLAIALGFDDIEQLKTDPDLRPLHPDPKFAELLRKATFNATGYLGTGTGAFSAGSAEPAPVVAAATPEEHPAPPTFQEGVPVGLYFMTRYWAPTRTLENAAWYFAPDGRVYQNLQDGFSSSDLAAHAGPKGTASAAGATLTVKWSDGTQTAADVERDGLGFLWQMGIFTAVSRFEDASEITGAYEREGSTHVGDTSGLVPRRLEFRADGSYSGTSLSTPAAGDSVAATEGRQKGRWHLEGHSLVLSPENGVPTRRIAFPCDDGKTVIKPDKMFFAGSLYKRRL